MKSAATIPKIDISPFLPGSPWNAQARKSCADDISRACTQAGFFYLVNHDIPVTQTDEVISLGREFFLNSSPEEKAAIVRKKVGVGHGDGARGWQAVRDNVTDGKRDWQEAVDFYREPDEETEVPRQPPYDILMGKNLWPHRPGNLQEKFEEYIKSVLQLGEAVLKAMGTALGPDNEDIFVQQTRKSFWGMRLIGYAPIPAADRGSDANLDGGISCGAHTDYGCVTLLLTDGTKGALQVQSPSGWIHADPIPGAFVVNIGDMMERWTNGFWKSTTHRVIHHGDSFRVSVPLFYEPDFRAKIQPLQTCIDRTGGVAKYGSIIYGQHLLSKVSKNFYSGTGNSPVLTPDSACTGL